MCRADGLTGGHVIRLGPGNDGAAREALAAWPGGLQLGGESLQACGVDVPGDDERAPVGGCARHLAADTTGRAGDEHDPGIGTVVAV